MPRGTSNYLVHLLGKGLVRILAGLNRWLGGSGTIRHGWEIAGRLLDFLFSTLSLVLELVGLAFLLELASSKEENQEGNERESVHGIEQLIVRRNSSREHLEEFTICRTWGWAE